MSDGDDLIFSIGKFLSSIREGLLDFGALATTAADAIYTQLDYLHVLCARYGWCFTPDFPLHELLNSAYEANSAKNPRQVLYHRIRAFLLENNLTQVHRMLLESETSPSLGNKRIKIIRDCMYALGYHGDCHFNAANVVVPTLISVIDGVLADFSQRHLGIDNWHMRGKKQKVRAALATVCYAFDEPGLTLLFDVLFANTQGSSSMPTSNRHFNRHHIMHGNWLEFGRIEYVLRLFLLLFFAAYITDEYAARQANGDDEPASYRTKYSMYLSKNPLAELKPMALERIAARGLRRFDLPDER